MDITCQKIGKNKVRCLASDESGFWHGECTKRKNGTWSCKQIDAIHSSRKPVKITGELAQAILHSKDRKSTARKKKRPKS